MCLKKGFGGVFMWTPYWTRRFHKLDAFTGLLSNCELLKEFHDGIINPVQRMKPWIVERADKYDAVCRWYLTFEMETCFVQKQRPCHDMVCAAVCKVLCTTTARIGGD